VRTDLCYFVAMPEMSISVPKPTKLEQFLDATGIKPAHLAQECGYSRQYLLSIRKGLRRPTRRCIAAIVAAIRRLSHTPIKASDLFDVGGG
jgi:predicted transcriptional regulator